MILAVETATRATSVALLRGDEILAELTTLEARVHAERLLPAIDTVLARTGVALGDVEGFAVSVGPGSFTGLRIGLATVKGLSFARGVPIAPVPTLAALAGAAPPGPGPVAALLDARRGEVYAALRGDAGGGERVATAEELAAWLPEGTAVVVGEGAAEVADALRALRGDRVRLLAAALGRASAARVARQGAQLLRAGEGVGAHALAARYLRRAEAEVRRTGERFEG